MDMYNDYWYIIVCCVYVGEGGSGVGAGRSGVGLSGVFDVILCCAYVAGHIEAGFSLPPGCVSGVCCLGLRLYMDYSVYVICYVYVNSMFVGGGGICQPVVGGVRSPSS